MTILSCCTPAQFQASLDLQFLTLLFYASNLSFSLFFSLKSAFPGFESSNVRFLLKPCFLFCILLPFARLVSEFGKVQLVDWMGFCGLFPCSQDSVRVGDTDPSQGHGHFQWGEDQQAWLSQSPVTQSQLK